MKHFDRNSNFTITIDMKEYVGPKLNLDDGRMYGILAREVLIDQLDGYKCSVGIELKDGRRVFVRSLKANQKPHFGASISGGGGRQGMRDEKSFNNLHEADAWIFMHRPNAKGVAKALVLGSDYISKTYIKENGTEING
jgi:hypothetical protein